MNGELERAGGAWRLRFTRRLSHPPEKVWRALTEPEHLEHWFPQRVVGEWTVGGTIHFEHDASGLDAFKGEVLAVEPPSLLEFTWGTDTIRLEIAAESAGCVLTLLDTIDEVGKAARDGAGWHTCLDLLEHTLDGTTPTWDSGERWRQVHPGYVEKFGPEASTIGPPEGALDG